VNPEKIRVIPESTRISLLTRAPALFSLVKTSCKQGASRILPILVSRDLVFPSRFNVAVLSLKSSLQLHCRPCESEKERGKRKKRRRGNRGKRGERKKKTHAMQGRSRVHSAPFPRFPRFPRTRATRSVIKCTNGQGLTSNDWPHARAHSSWSVYECVRAPIRVCRARRAREGVVGYWRGGFTAR
jgi:hypothetical protein